MPINLHNTAPESEIILLDIYNNAAHTPRSPDYTTLTPRPAVVSTHVLTTAGRAFITQGAIARAI